MIPGSDAESLLALAGRLCCVGIFFQSLELVWLWRDLREGRLLSWRRPAAAANPWRRLLQRSHGFWATLLIVVWRAVASLVCLGLPFGETALACLTGSLLVTQFYYNRRFRLIFSNADHMNLVCLAGATVGSLPTASSTLRFAALAFLAFQVSLAYVAGGVDKIFSVNWRTGLRLTQVFQDSAHRCGALGEWLARRLRWACVFSRGVILLELFFPVCLVLPSGGFWGVIAVGLLFHATVAFTMGLRAFFWAFAAMYPALYFIHARLAEVLHR